MCNWRRISDIVTYYGKGVTPKYVEESSIIVLNQKCIRNNRIDYSFAQYIDDSIKYNENKYLKVGDLLINSTGQGTAGRVAIVEFIPDGKRLIVDSHILVLRTRNFYESKCLNYSLFSIENILQKYIDGSTGQGELDRVRLFNIQTSYTEDQINQQKIATVLSTLDDKIELNNRITAELEQMAKTLYDYWFVQFDFPNEEGEPYKSSGGKMVYDEVLKREIPEGWERGGLAKLAILNPTLSIKKNTISPYIEMASVPTSGYMTSEPQQKEFSGGIKFQNGDIVIARITPCLENGKTALITLLDEDSVGFGSTEFINIRARKKEYTSFLAITSRTDVFRNYAISKMIGTSGRKRVDAKEISTFQLPIPSEDLLTKFAGIVDVYFEKMTLNTKQNQQLTSLRDWLLPMLMNGQVTVGEVLDHSEENSEEQMNTIGQEGTQMHLFA